MGLTASRSEQTEFLAIDPRGALSGDLTSEFGEGLTGLTAGISDHQGNAKVPALTQGRLQGDLCEKGNAKVLGERLATPTAKDLVARAVIATEPTHVLDHSAHRQ